MQGPPVVPPLTLICHFCFQVSQNWKKKSNVGSKFFVLCSLIKKEFTAKKCVALFKSKGFSNKSDINWSSARTNPKNLKFSNFPNISHSDYNWGNYHPD